ncbi:BBE domain-containing protein [Streptomyces thinghirensis]|nr:BBE domain-containing protein [Streptomyces thinghirensis]
MTPSTSSTSAATGTPPPPRHRRPSPGPAAHHAPHPAPRPPLPHGLRQLPDPDLPDWQHAYYRGNYERLVTVKEHYDPTTLFRYGQSITGNTPHRAHTGRR